MLVQLILIFVFNAISNCLGTLKTIFTLRQLVKPAYVTTFVEALLFIYTLKMVTVSDNIGFALVFACGKLTGMFLGNLIDDKLALGYVEATVYKHSNDESKALADRLRKAGYSVTTSIGYGVNGHNRLVLNIIVRRSELPNLHTMLKEDGNKVNMVIKDVNKAIGKVGDTRVPTVKVG